MRQDRFRPTQQNTVLLCLSTALEPLSCSEYQTARVAAREASAHRVGTAPKAFRNKVGFPAASPASDVAGVRRRSGDRRRLEIDIAPQSTSARCMINGVETPENWPSRQGIGRFAVVGCRFK
jgi:hypothetical protein